MKSEELWGSCVQSAGISQKPRPDEVSLGKVGYQGYVRQAADIEHLTGYLHCARLQTKHLNHELHCRHDRGNTDWVQRDATDEWTSTFWSTEYTVDV